jgi:UDP-glucuronate decarboxylase
MQKTYKILVAGGAGFVGSNLCRKLTDLGNSVVCVDDLSTGRLENIKDLNKLPNFEFIQHDITKTLDVQVDQIYNLACPASPIQYQKRSFDTLNANILGTINLLELAKKYNSRILQASTSEVYGDPLQHPQRESYYGNVSMIGPRACYDEGKRCAETYFIEYQKKYKLDIKIARIFNTYGPGMDNNDGRVVSNFVTQALNNEPLTINGNGLTTRSFCFIDDLIKGLVLLMNSPSHIDKPINLGNPHEITLLELANEIIKATNSNSILKYFDIPTDDPVRRCPDITLAKHLLKWNPSVELAQGINATVDYFKGKA